jgi:hypothetical protein
MDGVNITEIRVGGQVITNDPTVNNDPQAIKRALIDYGYTELASATPVVEEGVLKFLYEQGSKG